MSILHCALAGNPNVGKSTVFNALTGLHQHTGNWPGKTVETRTGTFRQGEHTIRITDLPGIYSLDAHSPEETVAREFLLTHTPDCVVIVCDCVTLSRNLILALQILETCPRCVLCLNLMDEAEKRGIRADTEKLSALLGCPVIPCAAREKTGLDSLREAIASSPALPEHTAGTAEDYPARADAIAAQVLRFEPAAVHRRENLLDGIFAGRFTAYPVMALFVFLVFWLTIRGAGYLSAGLEAFFSILLPLCRSFLEILSLPDDLVSFLTDGILSTITQVIAVMLPPMAVFFPLFTLFEDLGYLPRVAFTLDRLFCRCGACGKQSLTMLMGLGCNAAGVTGCRIIDSPRERKLAILTNAFVPCNGRLPMVLFLSSALVFSASGHAAGRGMQAVLLLLILCLCTLVTLAVCRLLSATILRGTPSAFTLELPSYRIPRFGQVLVRSVLDRTLLVLGRAVTVAAPAGGILWFLNCIPAGGEPLYTHITRLLDPMGQFFGMDGVILTAFLLSLPAAEMFLPLVLAGYGTGTENTLEILLAHGWNGVTVLCVLWFTLFHWPCSTTVLTIRRETGSSAWTALAVLIPTLLGFMGCALIRWGAVLLVRTFL
ncbi:MAG: ferrous iron transporter B [Clostridia bacterium]|nr:ferrous iron transporter B [Clostridia bacterium]